MTTCPLDLSCVRPALIRDDHALFLLVTSASFIESGSDTYTANLLAQFEGDAQVGGWLRDQWEPEELGHGRMLRAYVERVWPELDWEAAYADFFADYSQLCTMQQLEPTRGLELAARCVVEMGTTVYYTALHEASHEPVLRALTWRIRGDEVDHYKHFYAAFLKYREAEGLGRWRVLRALARRVLELRSEDASIALHHALHWGRRSRPAGDRAALDAANDAAVGLIQRHVPMELATRMLIKPLRLGPAMQRAMVPPLASIGRTVLLR